MRQVYTYLLLQVFFLLWTSQGWGQKNVELVGRLEYELNSRIQPDQILNDVWGYVAPDGHEYALVGTFLGFSIVDLEDPTDPQEIHFIPGPETFWRDIKTFEEFAYVSNEGGQGILVVDLSGLPESIDFKNISPEGVTTAHNLYQDGGTLYITGTNNFNGGIVSLRLGRDPWNPEFIGAYSQAYVHDVYVRGGRAFAAEINAARLRILDISNPANTQVRGERAYPGAFTHNTWLNDKGDVCFTTDELTQAYVIAWDVSDPENIEELDRIRSSQSRGAAIPHNVHVLNDYLIISHYGDGIQIVDATRPNNLVEVGFFDTAPDKVAGFEGCWGAYPFLPSGNILATDLSKGLFILRPDYQAAAYLEGIITDANTGNGITNVSITIEGRGEILEFSNNLGEFATGIAESEELRVTFSHPDYQTQTQTYSLTQGEVTLGEVALIPLVNITETSALPNPISEEQALTLLIPERDGESWELIDSSGRKILGDNIPPGLNRIEIDFPFAQGVYHLIVNKEGGDNKIIKVLK